MKHRPGHLKRAAEERPGQSAGGAAVRLDVALFELRLFRSRSQATLAIQDGAVLLNGEAVKPGHRLHPGDRVTLAGRGTARTLEVLELPRGSLSKEAARALVREVGEG
jgi:ribosome-associated heat shock protein Hsp15